MNQTELATERPRILVVDDSRIVRATVKKHLAAGFDVVEEVDGEAGWAKLSEDDSIQVLMSDLSMPRLDGFGLLSRVRKSADPRIRQTPVIIISGEEDPDTKQQAVERGANDFVTKSTDRAEMVARVSAAVKLAKTARELRSAEAHQAKTTTTDVQTGAATEHMLHIEGHKALAHAARYHGEATLLLFEIDDFDTLRADIGEAVANRLIGLVVQMVSGRLRKEETLARLGEQRFGVVLYADAGGSRVYAERLRETIAAAKVNYGGKTLRITASVAIASAVLDQTTGFDALVALAQTRLESARAQGGDRVESPPTPERAAPAAIDIETALAWLAEGRTAELKPHLPALLERLKPLLALAQQA